MNEIETIDVDGFKILLINSKPPRLEAKLVFDREDISQKLIFTLMEIAHIHGFGLSPPSFGDADDPSMIFMIGTILPSSKSINKYSTKLRDCLFEIQEFIIEFSRQLDFSKLDISMFRKIKIDEFYPEHMSALRDQHYGGSWNEFHKQMLKEKRAEEANIIKCCIKFEKINSKDIGLVGHKLGYMLFMLEKDPKEVSVN